MMERIFDPALPPVQLSQFLTRPAENGEAFLLKLVMEVLNRFPQLHVLDRDLYVAAASTDEATVAIGGTKAQDAFNVRNFHYASKDPVQSQSKTMWSTSWILHNRPFLLHHLG